MKMLHGEAETLRRRCADLAGSRRHLYGRSGSVALDRLAGGSAFGGRLDALYARSVLLVAREQLNAAVALIEPDGVARRIVIRPLRCPARTAALEATVVPFMNQIAVSPRLTCAHHPRRDRQLIGFGCRRLGIPNCSRRTFVTAALRSASRSPARSTTASPRSLQRPSSHGPAPL
jgi:hypothetical protein